MLTSVCEHKASAGNSIYIVDNGGYDEFFSVNARGVLAFFDGEDWWAYMASGLWCIGKEGRNFVAFNRSAVRDVQWRCEQANV